MKKISQLSWYMKFLNTTFMCLIIILVGACAEDTVEMPEQVSNTDEPETLSDWEALFADTPDPKTLPDELKADQNFPKQFDLVDLQSPVKSQGSRGVCSIFSTVALMEHLYIKQGAVSPDFSEQFLQWSVKAELGRFKTTSGSNGSANLSAINRFGVVTEETMPYESSAWSVTNDERCGAEKDKRPMECFTNGEPSDEIKTATRFKLPNSRWISSDRQNLKAFMTENQTGVVVGMTFFYQSWNHRKSPLKVNSEYSRQGYVLYPNEVDKEKSLEKRAGHSILIVGWDDELEVPMVDENGQPLLDEEGEPLVEKGFFLFKNSWGTARFGTANPFGPGYGWLSMRYVEEYGSSVSTRPPAEDLSERCDDGLDNNFDGLTDCDDLSCAEATVCQVTPESEVSFSVSSQESLELPDQEETIAILEVDNVGQIEQLTLSFEIEHTFSGDLQIDLQSPMGTRINLVASDNELSVGELKFEKSLEAFRNEVAQGEWQLIITDRFAEDSGVLKSWSLTGIVSQVQANDQQVFATSPSVSIPDNDASGIASDLEVNAEGTLKSLSVQVKINHSYRGDLVLKLVHPNGESVTLVDREGRNSEDLDLDIAVPSFLGFEANGIWQLQVTDLGAGDQGTLVEWGLSLISSVE